MDTLFFKTIRRSVYLEKSKANVLSELANVLFASPRVEDIFERDSDAAKSFSALKAELSKGVSRRKIFTIIIDFKKIMVGYIFDDGLNLHYLDNEKNQVVFQYFKRNEHRIKEKIKYLSDLLAKKDLSQDELLELLILIDCHLALLMFASNVMVELTYSQKQDQVFHKLFKDDESLYYRGHSDSDFKFSPSIYRNLKIKDSTLNLHSLEEIYSNRGIVKKYCAIFSKDEFSIDYQFLAYIQHSCAYSPFLDFTSDEDVAKVFATYETNYNSYRFNDAALFAFHPYPTQKDHTLEKCLSNYEVSYHEKRLTYKSKVYGKPVWSCVLTDFSPSYAFNDKQCNDRMKYQKGSFLFVYKCVIVNGRICMTYDSGFFMKMVIKRKNRNGMYNRIVSSRPYLEYRYLLDPYLYLSECNKKVKRIRRKKTTPSENLK